MDESHFPKRLSLLRKLIHVGTTIFPAIGWLMAFWLEVALAAAFMAASLVLEASRRWWPWVNRLLWHLIPSVFREWEDRHILGSTWLAAGALGTLLLCGRDAGGTAILFLAWGDPAAELVGRAAGGDHSGKTVAGSLACLFACLLAGAAGVLLGGLSVWAALVGAAVATIIERWSPPPDDNLWMPVFSGMAILFVEWLVNGTVPWLFERF
jgi:dolichol kinase